MKELTNALEKKKSVREAAFHQGTYGIEKIDAATLSALPVEEVSESKKLLEEKERAYEQSFYPEGYEAVTAFEELGGSKDDSNFIAVVHIDGNGMGKRMAELYEELASTDWNTTKNSLRKFSEGIDSKFKEAFRSMTRIVGESLSEGKLEDLDLENHKFPIRRVITAGDDICFVTEGRIGIECAVIFLQELNKPRKEEKPYCACAGVAIVHEKYPFYKAYELAELLCSNAKKYGAKISPEDNGRGISAIDWHIEFGEISDSLEEIRRGYQSSDGASLELRPYIVCAGKQILSAHRMRKYDNFKRLILNMKSRENEYATGKIKGLRSALKEGETAARYYLKFNKMEDILLEQSHTGEEIDLSRLFSGEAAKREVFVTEEDGSRHSILFDAIELLDTYISVTEGGVD